MSTDSELVRLAQGGQAAAREELLRRWSARVLAVCHAKVRSAQPKSVFVCFVSWW